jgi:transketolase N-terminal domain/subunit
MSEGKTYKVDIKKVAERVQVMREEVIEKPAEKKEITTKAVIEALIAVLIEKGIITREELIAKTKEKSRLYLRPP